MKTIDSLVEYMRCCFEPGIRRCLIAMLALSFPLTLSAQVNGRLSGTVEDALGKPVAGARVTLNLAPDTMIQVAATFTNQSGTFSFSELLPTFYDLTVEATGFKTMNVRNVKVYPLAETTLPTEMMEMGTVTQQVTATASLDYLQTESGQVVDKATQDQVAQLPLPGRDALSILDTLPGVQNNGRAPRTIDGQSVSFANITYDGINVQESFLRNGFASGINSTTLDLHTDQLSEATIVTSNPAFTFSGGSAQVAFLSPGKPNEFHGSIYELNVPGGIGAQYWFDNLDNTPRSAKLNQVGGSIGGPIVKSKLFLFANYEGDFDRSTVTRLGDVPTSALKSSDPTLQKVLNLVPSNSSGLYRGTQNNGGSTNLGLARLDYLASAKHAFGLTFYVRRSTDDEPFSSSPFGRVPVTSLETSSPFYAAFWRWQPNAHLTNEVRAGANLPSIDFHNSLRTRFPFIALFADPNYFFSNPTDGLDPQGRNDFLYNYQDNLTYEKGAHSFKMGVSLQQYRLDTYGINYGSLDSLTVPVYGVDDIATGDVGGVLQRFNINSPSSGYTRGTTAHSKPSANLVSAYFQDNWKIRRSLTLNLGLRYDYLSPVVERAGDAIIPAITSNAANAVYSQSLAFRYAHNLYNPDRNNFSPYVGFAWKVSDKPTPIVLRGAYSIIYVNDDLLRTMDTFSFQNSFQSYQTFQLNSSTLSSVAPVAIPALPSNLTLQSLDSVGNPVAVRAIDPRLRTPFVQQWNIGVETQVHGFLLGARYVGNLLSEGLRAADRNQPLLSPDFLAAFRQVRSDLLTNSPNLQGFTKLLGAGLCSNLSTHNCQFDDTAAGYVENGEAGELAHYFQTNGYNGNSAYNFFGNPLAPNGFDLLSNLGKSRYDGLQVTVSRRVTNGLSLTANYTFSKSLGNLDDAEQGAVDPFLDIHNQKLSNARSPFNLTHSFKSTAIYDLPYGRSGAALKTLPGRILGGWSLSGIFLTQSGSPFSLLSGLGTFTSEEDSTQNSVATSLTSGQIRRYFGINKSPGGTVSFVNAPASAFRQPDPGTVGNLQARQFDGPGSYDLNLGIRKVFTVTERTHLEIRAEGINVLNHVNWLVGDQTYQGTSLDGKNSTFDNNVSQWVPPRVLQFTARITF